MSCCCCCFKRDKYKYTPILKSNYDPISDDEMQITKDQKRENYKSYIFVDGRQSYIAPIFHVYEGVTKFLRPNDDNKPADPNKFMLGLKQLDENYYAIYYLPYTITIRRFLIESGLFDPKLFYYIGTCLLTEIMIEKTIKELVDEDGLQERSIIEVRQMKKLFTSSKIGKINEVQLILKYYS